MDQREMVAGVFDRAADTYDQLGVEMFGPIASRLVAELALRPGERALDVGCGRGAVLVQLAQVVGPAGAVAGVDLSPRMADAARQAVRATGVETVDVRVGDAQNPEWPAGSFDVVASSLVLFFLPDPIAALRRWAELLAAGGRVGVSTFGASSASYRPVEAVFEPFVPPAMRAQRASGASTPFSSDSGVEGLLDAAGFTGVRTADMELDVRFRDEMHWYEWSWSVGQRALWEQVPGSERHAVRELAFQRLQDCRDEAGRIGFRQRVRFTLGTKPHRQG